jgi:hypothetical protein
MIEVLKQMYQLLLTEPHAPAVCDQLEVILRQAIAELESQEPVAKLKTSNVLLRCHSCGYSDKLTMQIEYTPPPQRTWVGLTDEEHHEIVLFAESGDWHDFEVINATEARLKELNT